MEGASTGPAGHLQDILPKDARFVLAWNPPQFYPEEEEDVNLHTREPPDTAPSALRTTTIGSSRPAAFYDRHLAPHLILERVVIFDTLVSTMASTVDQAIQEVVTKHPLPKNADMLLSENQINYQVWDLLEPTKYRESGIVETYSKHTATYCLPIASTLAIHPSSKYWGSVLHWPTDGRTGRWAVTDGVLRISKNVFRDDQRTQRTQLLLQNEDDGKKAMIKQLASCSALAVWEMKNLTVGTAQMMEEVVQMGLTYAKFPWKKCTTTNCTHQGWKNMEESSESYGPGFDGIDAVSPPWTLPDVPSTSVNSRLTSMRKGLRSASAQGGTTAKLSYKEHSSSPSEDGERVREKRRRKDLDSSEDERPSKKLKEDLNKKDESYDPSPRA